MLKNIIQIELDKREDNSEQFVKFKLSVLTKSLFGIVFQAKLKLFAFSYVV